MCVVQRDVSVIQRDVSVMQRDVSVMLELLPIASRTVATTLLATTPAALRLRRFAGCGLLKCEGKG